MTTEPRLIKITRHYSDEFTAITDDYDGPESPMGRGDTWIEAVRELLNEMEGDEP